SLFFFQAEDGIRDFHVTGVQTCALPIYFRLVHAAVEPVEERNIEGKTLVVDGHRTAQKTSNRPAAPMPPPMHMVTTASFAPRRWPSIRAWPVRRWPLTP